jgi:hypothetical protein
VLRGAVSWVEAAQGLIGTTVDAVLRLVLEAGTLVRIAEVMHVAVGEGDSLAQACALGEPFRAAVGWNGAWPESVRTAVKDEFKDVPRGEEALETIRRWSKSDCTVACPHSSKLTKHIGWRAGSIVGNLLEAGADDTFT